MTNFISADLILVNCNVITMDEKLPNASSIAIKNGEILLVGEEKDVLNLEGGQTELCTPRCYYDPNT